MEKVYTGKTKDVYKLADGNLMFKFKDDATGTDGVFDPGSNTVGLVIEGLGLDSARLSEYFFNLINGRGFPTHYISADIGNAAMTVKPAAKFGKGLEFICRYRAVGSFYARYSDYVAKGDELNGFVEVSIKNDEKKDPIISEEALLLFGLMDKAQYERCVALTGEIAEAVRQDLQAKGMELYDIKFEFGHINGEVTLIDEISAGNMRAYKDHVWLQPDELIKEVLG